MENNIQPKHLRILALAPCSAGFGFAVLEGVETLIDWGVKEVKGDKNARCLAKIGELIALYQPDVIVLQDTNAKGSRRYPRIVRLSKSIIAIANTSKIRVKLFSREEVMKVFFSDGKGTKHALAGIIAARFPQELATRLPPKRRAWMTERSAMGIFEAVALALVRGLSKGQNMPLPN